MKRTRIITKDINEDAVMQFLNSTGDYNSIHRKQRYIPGMFYLGLLANTLEGSIDSLKLKFINFKKYPARVYFIIAKDGEGERVRVIDGFGKKYRVLFEGKFKHKEAEEARGIEGFASVSGVKLGNLEKIWLTCLIPGKLLESFEEEGIYLGQSLSFNSGADLRNTRLIIGKPRKKLGTDVISTDYIDSADKIVARGKAGVRSLDRIR